MEKRNYVKVYATIKKIMNVLVRQSIKSHKIKTSKSLH